MKFKKVQLYIPSLNIPYVMPFVNSFVFPLSAVSLKKNNSFKDKSGVTKPGTG